MNRGGWLNILAACGKYVKGAKGKVTHSKILHTCHHVTVRLQRMKLMKDNLCWKCRMEAAHCKCNGKESMLSGLRGSLDDFGPVQRSMVCLFF